MLYRPCRFLALAPEQATRLLLAREHYLGLRLPEHPVLTAASPARWS